MKTAEGRASPRRGKTDRTRNVGKGVQKKKRKKTLEREPCSRETTKNRGRCPKLGSPQTRYRGDKEQRVWTGRKKRKPGSESSRTLFLLWGGGRGFPRDTRWSTESRETVHEKRVVGKEGNPMRPNAQKGKK